MENGCWCLNSSSAKHKAFAMDGWSWLQAKLQTVSVSKKTFLFVQTDVALLFSNSSVTLQIYYKIQGGTSLSPITAELQMQGLTQRDVLPF
jgi:hypothetical protein